MICDKCKDGIGHHHKIEYLADFWQPTQGDWVCWCGKPYAHHHKNHKLKWIPAKPNPKKISVIPK